MTLSHISELLIQPCCQQRIFWCLLPIPLLPDVLLLVLLVAKSHGALGRLGESYQALEVQAHLFSDLWQETASIVLWVNMGGVPRSFTAQMEAPKGKEVRVPQPINADCPSAGCLRATSALSSEESVGEGEQCHKTGKYQLLCLKILTSYLSLRKGACYMQVARLRWVLPIACLTEFHPLAFGTTPVIPRIIRFCKKKNLHKNITY